ncbi:acetyl-CoA synthetase-like protein [Sistotremastrum niveocremeum HHB9708]|uniref:Acetyl-CoA synthetase-like protein n=1 Tax=Sistotremastrum niveocremeum HHB9708 TaxID=1314777 RepID=A0A164W8Q8_9AGAM|nr:acetyl-CoA synthetase-like protein [Sistotremastrum niveocremeum HHB9708]
MSCRNPAADAPQRSSMTLRSPGPTPNYSEVDVLTWIFDDQASRYDGGKPLYINGANPEQKVSRDQLRILTRKIGHGLRELAGVKPGDVVLCAAQNHFHYPAIVFGIICAGAIFTGSGPAYTKFELMDLLKDCGARVIFASAMTLPVVSECAEELAIPKTHVFLIDGARDGYQGLEDLLAYEGQDWPRLSTYQEAVSTTAALVYSSGTTGLPKGCELTHWQLVSHETSLLPSDRQLVAKPRNYGRKYVEPISLGFPPFHRAFGLQIFIFATSRLGQLTYIVEAPTFTDILDSIQKHRITHIYILPSIAVLLMKSPQVKDYDLSSIIQIACSGAPLGTEVALAVEKIVDPDGSKNVRLCQAWGMSELGVATNFDIGDCDEETQRLSVGQLLAGVEAKIVDEDGNEIKQGEPGEIWLKAPFLFKGYWKNPKATADAFTSEGWLKTGDIGKVDHRGMFFIVDRKKEMIKIQGSQVAPAELEATLLLNPDVLDAAVIGVTSNEYGGEQPKAFIVRSNTDVTAASIHTWINERLASFKHLTGGIKFVKSNPKNATGKILRSSLRAQLPKLIAQ